MQSFVYYFSAIGALIAGSMLFPALVAFGVGEIDVGLRLLLYGALGGFLCVSVFLAILGSEHELERRMAILLAVTGWVAFPLFLAFPLADISELNYAQSVFQSLSVFTTTSAMIFPNPEQISPSVLFLLAQIQWLGGFATLITFILVLAPWEIGGLPKVNSASEAASIVASQNRLVAYCGGVLRGYSVLTLLCFVLLLIANVGPFDAIILSFTALSTGGVVPWAPEGLDLLLGDPGMVVMGVFLIVGATSIFWHRNLVRLRLHELRIHQESYFLIVIWLLLAIFIAYVLNAASGGASLNPNLHFLSEGVLNAASIVSTSGIQSRPGVFPLLPESMVLLLVLIGAGIFSTGGGIRLFRIGVMISQSESELNRLVYPSSVQTVRYSGTQLSLSFMKGVWGLFAVWIMALGIMTFMLALSGIDFQASFTAAIASLSNAGPMYGTFWDPSNTAGWPAYSDMTAQQLGILTTGMILGRLEIIAVLASVMLLFKRYLQ